jgi:uncharacterized membrane protein
MTLEISFYTKNNCSLCEKAKILLSNLKAEFPHNVSFIQIDQDEGLEAEFGIDIPIIKVGPYTVKSPITEVDLRMTLGAAKDVEKQKIEDDGKRHMKKKQKRSKVSSGDKVSYFIAKNYMWFVTTFLVGFIGLAFLAPVLMSIGQPNLAKPIYTLYGATCHKFAFRSWFLFGEQVAYPRKAANVDELISYGEIHLLDPDRAGWAFTGSYYDTLPTDFQLNDENIFEARNFLGSDVVGYKVAFCERDVAIWSAMLLFSLVFMISGKKIKPLPWFLWILIGMGPIALDGFSQLFSQLPNWSFTVYRESTPFLRTLTGAIFGFITGWFGIPVMGELMDETKVLLAGKFSRLNPDHQDK